MKNKIYVAGVWGFGNRKIMEQFQNDPEVEFLRYDFKYFHQINKAWNIIRRRLGGFGTGILRWLLKTPLLDDSYALSHCEFDVNEVNYVVIFNSALLHYYSKQYFERLKGKHPSLRYVLYVIDPLPEGLWKEIEDVLPVFERVFTIHSYNVERYGFEYLPYIYGRPQLKAQFVEIPKPDLYYCGVATDYRQDIIYDIIKECEKEQISYDIFLKPYENNWIQRKCVHYSEMPYEENVRRLLSSRCVLEVMHEGFVGITQRYLEAIVYNKKLLTNNAEIKKLPYYDTGYMCYFEEVEDIDWDWLRSNEVVDYHYQGDFEPGTWKKNLLKMLGDHDR